MVATTQQRKGDYYFMPQLGISGASSVSVTYDDQNHQLLMIWTGSGATLLVSMADEGGITGIWISVYLTNIKNMKTPTFRITQDLLPLLHLMVSKNQLL